MGIAHNNTAIMASYQIITALLMRERFGKGQKVETSILGTVSYMLYFNHLVALITGREIPKHEQATADPLRNYYKCKDGKWIIHTQPRKEEYWQVVCQVLDIPELLNDARYDSIEKRMAHSEVLVKIYDKAFLKRPRHEWIKLFSEKNLVVSAVNTISEAVNDPQLLENGYLVDYEDPDMGKIRIPGFPIHFSGAELNRNFQGPRLGEHTDEVLKTICQYSESEIAALRKEKII